MVVGNLFSYLFPFLIPFLILASASIDGALTTRTDNGVIPLYDHLEVKRDILIGETQWYAFEVPEDIEGVTSWPIDLHVYTSYTYVGDIWRDANVIYSFDENATTGSYLGAVPMDDDEGEVIPLDEDDIVYIGIAAEGPSIVNDLTIELWCVLTQRDLPDTLYGDGQSIVLYDDTHTMWMDVVEEEYIDFLFDIEEEAERFFLIDLLTIEHDLVLFGRLGSLPTTTTYDWKSDGSATWTGSVTVSATLEPGEWYIRVYGEDILFFTSSATFRLFTSLDGDFDNGSMTTIPSMVCLMMSMVIAALQ